MIQNSQPTKLLYLEYSPACCYWSFIKIFLLVSISKNFTIDEFVLNEAENFKTIYKAYCNNLLDKSNVLFLKYEEMISDFPAWLNKLSGFLEIKNKEEDPDGKWMLTWNDYLQRIKYFFRWLHNEKLRQLRRTEKELIYF